MFKNWLLEEEKAKVGRPKLANDELMKKSKLMLAFSLFVVLILSFFFGCLVKDVEPSKALYNLTLGKIINIKNKNGFNVKGYYNKNNDYVMLFKLPSKIKNYSADYEYTTYYLKNNKWIEVETKKYDNDIKSFKIMFESKKNRNVTWKVKFRLVNSNKVMDDFAPYDWEFVKSDKVENTYAYKIFTVKGYYSPVTFSEIKEANKNKDKKVYVSTDKQTPRKLNVILPKDNTYTVAAKYTDSSNNETALKTYENISDSISYEIPESSKVSIVTIKIWVDGLDSSMLKDIKLSNWLIKSKGDNSYITSTYLIKPSSAY